MPKKPFFYSFTLSLDQEIGLFNAYELKMKKFFRDISYPKTYKYSSDSEHIPLEFYEEAFPISESIDLLLGYFSSNAIKVLSRSFAEFIYNGGKMRLVTNHVYSFADYDNLINNTSLENEDKIIDIFTDLSEIERNLSFEGKHFFDCLKYLLKINCLEIIPVAFNNYSLSHCKKMILYDGKDHILTEGSINFTLPALIKNSESFQVETPWNGEISIMRIEDERENFEKIFSGIHHSYHYIDKEKIEVVINSIGRDKDISDLLDDSLELDNKNYSKKVKKILARKKERFIEKLKKISKTPKFPFEQGPRGYQKEAYLAWKKNDYKGILAMATGTGKTLTSLNILLEEYKMIGYYNAIVLVPTQILVAQWKNESAKFNFKNIFSTYDSNWTDKLKRIILEKRLGINSNFIFISTYASYNGKKFQSILKDYKCSNTVLIADEAHNLGTKRSISNFLHGIYKRIGLSATPNRNFDEAGTAEIEKYFNSYSPNHTFCYSMLKAIDNGFLTPYYYFPKFIKLNEYEMAAYAAYSEQLLRFFDFDEGVYYEEASNLLMKRKRIIHQAANKKNELIKILQEIKNDNFKHTIIYVPEGFEPDYSTVDNTFSHDEDLRIIDDYNTTVKSLGIKTHQIVGGMSLREREIILSQFNDGLIHTLTAMKTLDEGVDIPATRNAIFCASTGNPRQFIQRRGRVLRNSKDKKFATIYDLIVEPNDSSFWNYYPRDKRKKLQQMEINIFRSELFRVANFLYASKNLSDLHLRKDTDINKLVELTELYNLDIFKLINELIEADKT